MSELQMGKASRCLSKEETDCLEKELYCAIRNGRTAKVKLLINRRAPVDRSSTFMECTPLHTASIRGHADIVKLILEHKGDINARERIGNSPLISAALGNHMVTVRLLIEAGADTRIRGYFNETAYQLALRHGHLAVAEYLNNQAPQIRFYSSALDDKGQFHRAKGRSLRAISRDLRENGGFSDHMLHRLKHFCTGKRR